MKTELMSWSAKRRPEYLEQLCETTYDVLIIGGGITGAGILRGCGLQGIKAALIEKDDFAFGTSSKSTRLAHGGARYIVNLEFGLVREETHERDWMRNAFPNMVRPVPIIYANYNTTESLAMRMYFKIYDALSGWKNYKNTRHLSKKEIEMLETNLKFPGLHSGSLLYECIINDARLTIEVVKEGVMSGGVAVNYVRAKRVVTKNERAVGVEAQDRETGHILNINARNIINATGSGLFSSFQEGIEKMVHQRDRFEPNPKNRAVYETMYKCYQDFYPRVADLYRKTKKIASPKE